MSQQESIHSFLAFIGSLSYPAAITQVKMFDYPDILSGVTYCKSQSKYELWAFGLIVGAVGKHEDLTMVICCGGKDGPEMINILRPLELVGGRVRYQGGPKFVRLTNLLEEKLPSAVEVAEWRKRFAPGAVEE